MSDKQGQRRAKKERKRKDRQLSAQRHTAQPDLINCAVCGKGRKKMPSSTSGWRQIDWANKRVYICPDHFPSKETATVASLMNAYNKIIAGLTRAEMGSA